MRIKCFCIIWVLIFFSTVFKGSAMAQQSQTGNDHIGHRITIDPPRTVNKTSSILNIRSGGTGILIRNGYIVSPLVQALERQEGYLPTFGRQIEQISQELLETNAPQKRIKILFEVREKLKSNFTNWTKLEESQKQHLEKAYSHLWSDLLELREVDQNIFEAYKSDLKEDGYHTPSAMNGGLAMCAGVKGPRSLSIPAFFSGLHEDIATLLKNTKNAATIGNCCRFMVLYERELYWDETFPKVQRAGNCWELLEEKRKNLQSEPLTEHTAMGITILQKVFEERDPSSFLPPFLGRSMYLYDIENRMAEGNRMTSQRSLSGEDRRITANLITIVSGTSIVASPLSTQEFSAPPQPIAVIQQPSPKNSITSGGISTITTVEQQFPPGNDRDATEFLENFFKTYLPTFSPNSKEVFFMVLKNHYPLLSEEINRTLAENHQKEINVLFHVREQLKPNFTHWDSLNDYQKQSLEMSYAYLWRRLLELQEIDPKIIEEYKSELQEEGNHIPSITLVFQSTYFRDYQDFREIFVTLFKNTRNAAAISNCCHIMINDVFQMTGRPEYQEKFRSLERLELLERPNCWDLFREKQKNLRSEPLTEHTAMGIILLDSAFAYQRDYEDKKKNGPNPIQATIYTPPPFSYLFNMEKKMKGPPPSLKGPFYRDEIKKMLEQQ